MKMDTSATMRESMRVGNQEQQAESQERKGNRKMENENKLDKIEEMLVKTVEWYMNDDIPLSKKKDRLNVDLGANKMVSSIIAIEALKERAKNTNNTTKDIDRKIKRFS